jgi:hypothetical protein
MGFESTILVFERTKAVNAVDRGTTVIGKLEERIIIIIIIIIIIVEKAITGKNYFRHIVSGTISEFNITQITVSLVGFVCTVPLLD